MITRVALKALGCRTNQEEMVALSGMITSIEGFLITDNVAEADIIVVNSCSVTDAAESGTRRLLHSLSREAPAARICVTGCLAQQKPVPLSTIKKVTWIVGNLYKNDIGSILQCKPPGIYHSGFSPDKQQRLPINPMVYPPNHPSALRTRFPVKIQEGCNSACSYCIVPSLRGPSRSAPFTAIVDLCKKAVDAGYREIVLTGTHIGRFSGENGERLPDLVEQISTIAGDFRIRLSSLDPGECSERLLELIGKGEKLCNHLHVSLQSCSPPILDAMLRSSDTVIRLIDHLTDFRKQYPSAGIGADIIVGFPGETDSMFNDTVTAIERISLSYIHVFRYSKRPGTIAAQMINQIDEAVKNERSTYIRSIVQKSRHRFIENATEFVQRIIVESSLPTRGLTSNFIHVEIPGHVSERNSWLDVFVSEKVSGRFTIAIPSEGKAA